MTSLYDQHRSGGSDARPATAPRPAAFDAPGKRTLTEGATASDAAPIQRQGNGNQHPIVPEDIQVDQYQQGTDAPHFKDCGPACIVMALRAIGVEDKLREHINKQDPAAVTLEQELEHVRKINPSTPEKDALSVEQVRQCLIAVLQEIGVSTKVDLHSMFKVIGDAGYLDSRLNRDGRSNDPKHADKGRAEAFLQAACVDGSAAMVMGLPNPDAWGWGGTVDNPERRLDPSKTDGSHQMITDQGGSHFVLVWRPDPVGTPDSYVVMDPSWPAPKPNIKLETILQFIYARDTAAGGQSLMINIMAVPYAQVATYVPRSAAGGGGGGLFTASARVRPRQAKAGAAPAAAVEDRGEGRPLPPPTRLRMENLFGVDLSAVRTHEGGAAPSVGALAYTQGDEVHFAPGRFQPETGDGDRLLGHELAHVVQQRDGRVASPQHKGAVVEDAGLEAEADAFGERAARREVGGGVHASHASAAVAVQRDGDPGAIVKRLNDITASARARADALAPGDKLGATPPAIDSDAIKQELHDDTDLVTQLSLGVNDPTVVAAATAANDAIVAAYQALAVNMADATAAAWAAPGAKHGNMVAGFRRQSAGGSDDNYCGEFVKAQFVSAGLNADFTSIFNHADNVQDFFRYNAAGRDTNRIANFIRPHDDPQQTWVAVSAYHQRRNSTRTLVDGAAVAAAQAAGQLGTVMRPGDVVTLYLNGTDPTHADHVAMIRRVLDGKTFETIEGNNYVTDAAGKDEWGLGTNRWDSKTSASDESRTFHTQDTIRGQFARVFLVGRPSVVDFEAGHGYSFTNPTPDPAKK